MKNRAMAAVLAALLSTGLSTGAMAQEEDKKEEKNPLYLDDEVLVEEPEPVVLPNNVGNCGWGSKLFEGFEGRWFQLAAVTVNVSSSNQALGILFGTSGCSGEGKVTSNWQLSLFIDGNMTRLARDMSVGRGESLTTLAAIIGIDDARKPAFYQMAKSNFSEIFPSTHVGADEIRLALKRVMASDGRFAGYLDRV